MSKSGSGRSKRGTPRGHFRIGYDPRRGEGDRFAVADWGFDNGMPESNILNPARDIASALNNMTTQYGLQVNPEAINRSGIYTTGFDRGLYDALPTMRAEGNSNNMDSFLKDLLNRKFFTGTGKAGELLSNETFSSFDNLADALAYGKQYDQLQQAGYDVSAFPQFTSGGTGSFNALQSSALSGGRRAGQSSPEAGLASATDLQQLAMKGYRGNYVQGFK